MFESTLPAGAPELMRVSSFRRYLDEAEPAESIGAATTRLSSLNPSLLQDLLRFEREGRGSELLEVLAASLRHGRRLLVHVGLGRHVLPLTLFPREGLVHAPLTLAALLAERLQDLVVLHVEPALLKPPGLQHQPLQASAAECGPLAVLSWELALRGARDTLLPELRGVAAYRVTPAADLSVLNLGGPIGQAVARLRRETTNLREIAAWPGLDRERAIRMLNALYLQAALRVSRAHPAATNEGWRPPLRLSS
jgi:hypothetical protein